jgi:nucleotide-binding universal stress UspA family protein
MQPQRRCGRRSEVTERVIVAVNGGPESEAALDWAIGRARRHPVALDVTSIIPLGSAGSPRTGGQELPAYEEVLTDAVQRVEREAPGTATTGYLRRGDVRGELVSASARTDLLVIGAHEPRGIFHGILPHQIAAATCAPVAIAPAHWISRGGPVVVGADDDETSGVALDRAAAEAEQLGRPLVIVHAWRIPAGLLPGVLGLGPDPYAIVEVDHEQILQRCAGTVLRSHPGVELETRLREGPAAVELVELAASADLLVVGTHRLGTVPALLLGSVTHDVLISMPCPVLAVPHPDEEPVHRRSAATRTFPPKESGLDLY